MTDQQVERVLAEGCPIAAVLLARGGWLRSGEVAIVKAHDLWRIDLVQDGESWHSVFVEASSIVGVSVSRDKGPIVP